MKKQFYIEEANGYKRTFACEVEDDWDFIFEDIQAYIQKYLEAIFVHKPLLNENLGLYFTGLERNEILAGYVYIKDDFTKAIIHWS